LPSLRHQALNAPLPRATLGLRLRRLLAGLLLSLELLAGSLALTAGLFSHAAEAHAAEVLQVTGPDRVLIGDGNRSSTLRLGCVVVPAESAGEATELLRQLLPRHRRVNLRPLGFRDGEMVARINVFDAEGRDPAEALLAAGLAQPAPCA
jgi:hypothetical protein